MTEPDKPQQSPSDPLPPPPPGPPQPNPYGAYPGAYPPPPPPAYGGQPNAPVQAKNGVGIASLVVAVIGLLTVCGGIVLGVAAIILGVIGRGRVKRGEATNGGVALAGIVLGALGVVVSIAAIAVAVCSFDVFGGGDLVECMQRAGNDPAAQQQCEEDFTSNVEDQFSVTLTPSP